MENRGPYPHSHVYGGCPLSSYTHNGAPGRILLDAGMVGVLGPWTNRMR
jgi:hypothetical protein